MKSSGGVVLPMRQSRSSHEERGLKYRQHVQRREERRRSSHEERGLKSVTISLSVVSLSSRSSHEERGLKSFQRHIITPFAVRRSSHEERGLKFSLSLMGTALFEVAPRMRSVD